jgi:hypothetical protein
LQHFKPNEKRYVRTQNKLIGSLRIRQQRVYNNSCVSLLKFYGGENSTEEAEHACYADTNFYLNTPIVKEPFGPEHNQYQYKTCDNEIIKSIQFVGESKS